VYPTSLSSSSASAWAAGTLLVCLPLRGYVLHGGTLFGSDLIDPVYGTAYVGAVLTLLAGVLLVRGERDVTEDVTGSVLERPLRAFVVGALTFGVLAVLGVGAFGAIEGISRLPQSVGVVPVYPLLFLFSVLLIAATISIAVYTIATVLFGIVFGYLALARAIVGPYGWPPVIIAGAVLANILAFVPVASLVLELVLAATAVGGLLITRESNTSPVVETEPAT
jgi:hypothetical protein